MKSLTRPLILAIGICSAPAYGNTTWQPVRANNLHDAASKGGLGNQALTDMSYWTNGLGQVGSGAPTADDDLVFDKAKVARLRFHATTTGDFTFNSLQIGTDRQSATVVHDGGRPSCARRQAAADAGHDGCRAVGGLPGDDERADDGEEHGGGRGGRDAVRREAVVRLRLYLHGGATRERGRHDDAALGIDVLRHANLQSLTPIVSPRVPAQGNCQGNVTRCCPCRGLQTLVQGRSNPGTGAYPFKGDHPSV